MIKKLKKLTSSIAILELKEKEAVKKLILRSLRTKSNQKWIDVGCGSTPFKYLFTKHQYTGIDIEREGYGQAEKYVDKFYDGSQIPFDDNYFDGVLCNQVLGVCDDDGLLLSEIARVLKVGGYLVLSTPFIYREVEKPFDFRRFTSYGIIKKLEENKFKLIENMKILSSLETLAMLLSNYISNHTPTRILKIFIHLLICLPIQLFFSLISIILPDNRDLFASSVVLAKKDNVVKGINETN
jgi:ubiquinone/menaquinone biosynthesis C-methylase UbiE